MFDMFLNSVKLFLRGKLFQDGGAVFRAWIAGFLIAVVLAIALSYVNLWLAALVAGLVGGAAMPFLFRNLKYA